MRVDPVRVGLLDLTTALARSGATLAPDQRTGFWRSLGAYARIREACEWKNGELRARPHLLGTLRDSSRSALAGDLGQAMAWLYAIKKLRMTAVVDFGTGCGLLTSGPVPAPNTFNKRPDFMAATGPLENVVLLESKGMVLKRAGDAGWKGGLGDGLAQVNAGAAWISAHGSPAIVSNKYAISFGLVESGPSVAVVVDPVEDRPRELDELSKMTLLRHHVASWALTAGAMELAVALVSPGQIYERLRLVDLLPDTDRRGINMKFGGPALHGPCCWPARLVHLISADLVYAVARENLESALSSISSFNEKPMRDNSTRGPFEPVVQSQEDGFTALPDGTAAEWGFGENMIEEWV